MTSSNDVTHHGVDRLPIAWRDAIFATVLATLTIVLIWLAAVPWGPIVCPAVDPMPTNCDPSYRMGTSAVLTGIIIVVYVVTLLLALIVRMRSRALVFAGVTVLAVLLFASYFIVAWLPGFVIGAP